MITVQDRAKIRRAYHVEGKSMRQIAREYRHSYWTIRKALDSAEGRPYTLSKPKPAPKLGPYKETVERLLVEEAELPRKQRYTTRKIYEIVAEEGYKGSESNLRRHVGRRRREMSRPKVYVPLAFDPGQDAQVDWGEAQVVMAGGRETVQLFVMRLCYSRRTFAMAFPTQRQEAFFSGHVEAFHFFGGVAHTITYDNLKTAVRRIMKGRNRKEQERFTQLRSHYLFDSRFCSPGAGNEKGGVEHGVKYVRQNALSPPPVIGSFAELNELLRHWCLAEDGRQVARQTETIGEMFATEQAHLRPLPANDYGCYVSREVVLNPYCQVVFETNRYSVPVEKARKQLTLRAYPFRVEILHQSQLIAAHQRSYRRQQDILNPLHYLSLVAERPGAFEHAAPLRQWRSEWPPVYEQLLQRLRQELGHPYAVREFVQILQLHQDFAAEPIVAAIEQALQDNLAHLAGVTFCLHRLLDPAPQLAPLNTLPQPQLANIGSPTVPATQYDQLLREVAT